MQIGFWNQPNVTSLGRYLVLPVLATIAVIVLCVNGLHIAKFLDKAGLYEVGEATYRIFVRDGDNSLACVDQKGFHDFSLAEIQSERLNSCVKLLYGHSSLQMARRYCILGSHIQDTFKDYEAAASCYKKAAAIYRDKDEYHELLYSLQCLAFVQACQSKPLTHTLEDAIAIVPKPMSPEDRANISVLWSLSKTTGNHHLTSKCLSLLNGSPTQIQF
jgi:hypothetical protein